jgi:biopolymer transport protein ExbB
VREAVVLEQGMLQFALLGAGWVLWLLVVLSVGVLAVTLERLLFLVWDTSDRSALSSALDSFLRGGDAADFRKRVGSMKGFEARILNAGLEVGDKGMEAMERAMSGTALAEKMRMERGLSYLATVGANAPFVGLFGTVLGIIRAFHDLAKDMSDPAVVMSGISEALVATAVGLLVAIPAVVLYNGLSRWVKNRIARSESLADIVLARIVGREAAVDGA